MNINEFQKMHELQKNDWWYSSRTNNVKVFLDKFYGEGKNIKILDLASAVGNSFDSFKSYGDIYGIDIAKESIKYCKSNGINKIVMGDATELPFKDNSFDVVLALDAFEHFSDDKKAIRELKRVLKDGGRIISTTPALMNLWSEHDVAYQHKRRYNIGELRDKLYGEGLTVEYINYWTFFFMPLVHAIRKLRKQNKESPKSDFYITVPEIIADGLKYIQGLENNLIKRGYKFPFGVSILSVAKKPYFNGDKISVIIPVFNEERTISSVVKLTEQVFQENKLNGEIIVIDDKSTDSSLSISKRLFKEYNNIKLIENNINIGKTKSIKKGLIKSTGDIVITLDADLQYEPRDIITLMSSFDGNDVSIVAGYRKNRQDSLKRKFYSYFFNKFNGYMFNLKVHDINCGLKAYRKEVFEKINIGDSKWFIDVEILAKANKMGMSIKEIPVCHFNRSCGKSKIYLPLLIYETIVNSIKLRLELWKSKQ